MPGRPMTEEQKRKKRERERERQNGTPLIAQTWWKKLLHKFFSWTLNLLLFPRMSYFKRMHISKKWFSRFFLCSEMKLELITIICTLFGQTEIIDLFAGLFGFKSLRLQIVFRCALTLTRKFCPYVRKM